MGGCEQAGRWVQDAVGSTRGAAPVEGEGEQEPSPPWERTGRDWGGLRMMLLGIMVSRAVARLCQTHLSLA